MEDRIYEYWAATLQDGYIGDLIGIAGRAGGARALYEMSEKHMQDELGITKRLAGYIDARKTDVRLLEEDYHKLGIKGISYVNHKDIDFPKKLSSIPSPPYGIFVKGALPDELTPSVAIVGARECSEYGRLMAEFFGSRLAREGIQIISGMAWGIDGIAQMSALSAGGRSYAVMGCGVDITYPAKNSVLYRKLCENGNGVISEYAPGTAAEARRFPPRNRLISGLCDVLIVVEARAKSGTLITVDMATDQGKTVMIVPGRLTDNLSAGCLNLLYQGALPATGIDSVLEQLGINRQSGLSGICIGHAKEPADIRLSGDYLKVVDALSLDAQSAEKISDDLGIPVTTVMVILTKLEIEGIAREVWPGNFVREHILA